MLSTSIIFYLFVFTANIEKFPNTHLPAREIFSSYFCSFFGLFLDATLELNSREGKRFLGAVFLYHKNQLYHKNTSCPFSNLRPMLVLQAHRSGNLLQLQNLLVFFDGLHLHFGRCCSPRLCNYALARLFSCVIVFLSVCAIDVMEVFRSAMFSRLCVVAILLGCAVESVSSLAML